MSLLGNVANEKSLVTVLEQQRQQILETRDGTVEAVSLSDITDDLGLVESGEFRSGNGIQPGAGFTGVRMGYPGFEYVGRLWAITGVENDVLMTGMSIEDGFIYGGGGAWVLNNLGAIRTGINFFDRWNADNAGFSRRLEIGTFLNGSTPAGYLWFGDPTDNTNLQTNGDIELGNLNNFDTADSTTPTWAADSGSPYAGTYAALLTTTDDADGSELQTNGDFETGDFTGWSQTGTATWSVQTTIKRSGTYAAKALINTGQSATLTTNLGGTPRMAVTAGLYYRAELWLFQPLVGTWGTKTLSIKWYTATSGGALISTDSVTLEFDPIAFKHNAITALAPSTALGAEVVMVLANPSGNVNTFYDDFSFKPAQYGTLTTNLGGTPRMAVTAGNSYQFSVYAKTDTSGSGVWKLVQAEVKWYTATSGGSLVSTSTIPISLGTSYANTATPLTAPATSAGATIVITAVRDSTTSYDSTVLAYFDDISLRALTVSRYAKWLPNFTLEGGPLDFAELSVAPSTPSAGFTSDYADTNDERRFINDKGQDNQYAFGQRGTAVSLTMSTSEQAIISKTIKASTMGTKGRIVTSAQWAWLNNSGAGRTFTTTFNFGSYSLAVTSGSLGNHATSRWIWFLRVTTLNDQATNLQKHFYEFWAPTGAILAAETFESPVPQRAWGSSAIDTTADVTVSITVKVGNATVTQTTTGIGQVDGPYYGA